MAKEKKEKPEKEKSTIRLSGLLIGLACVFIALGALLIFVPQVSSLQICYALAGILMAFGIVLIVQYFLTEAYKDLQRYGFSIGAILVIAGAIGLVRAKDMAVFFLFALGALMLVAAIFKLQNALDLKALSDKSWGFWLIVAFAFAVCAIIILMNPFQTTEQQQKFTQYAIFVDGIVGLVGTIYLFFRLRSVKKHENDPAPITEEVTANASAGSDMVTEEREPESAPTVIDPDADDAELANMPEDFDAGIDDD